MKLKLHLLLLALCSMTFLQSCNNDDNEPAPVPEAARNAFDSKYPNVTNAHWELKRTYHIAEFYENGHEVEAWFTPSGEWLMTETDLGKNTTLLPAPVKSAWESSPYATWQVDDIDFYERPDKSFYLIEVETKGQKDRKLFYAPDGTLLKDVEDTENDDIYPDTAI